MRNSIRLAIFCLLISTGPAFADGYFAIEGSSVSVKNNIDEELNPLGVRFRIGSRLSDTFDIEAHAGYSADRNNAAYDVLGTAYVGAFLKGYVPVGFNSALFAMAGVTSVELKQQVNDQIFRDQRVGFSYGFGLETQLTETADLTADFVTYIDDEGLFDDISAVSIGIKLYF